VLWNRSAGNINVFNRQRYLFRLEDSRQPDGTAGIHCNGGTRDQNDPTNPRVGWFAAILFGTMCVVAVIEIVRICGLDQNQTPAVATRVKIRPALIYAASLIVTLFLGISDHFISSSFTESFPRPGVWLGTFLTTLAFYPLRERKEDFPNFTFWTIFCALMGAVSVVVSYLTDWVEQLL